MNITLIGSMNDTYSRMTHQWFTTNNIQAEYMEVDSVPIELQEAGVKHLPIVLLNGRIYCEGHDPIRLQMLTYR